ncbi:aminotransferase class I/II-fold pyridoxal phosphate-dependent enzyme [Deinococcus hopiensis]|uniref:Glycine C-acetyltransferase n=1 Tax=Deinococcus hopiensis KR-140 TaxID=695939 RepID=A0A1W1U9P3_9DEIO|nr:aminotransferase class I/II-fold pyridoxal phosphate-dependent enzyme [Deinococcus hopiensis]SMB77762.1 glycine C-acetyltransferase [Deinococcus hopiensis KR-140]
MSNEYGQALSGSVADFRNAEGVDLLDRWMSHYDWWERRSEYGVDPYSKYTLGRITTVTQAHSRKGRVIGSGRSINFASQDYLSLAGHPAVCEAAKNAIDNYGVHSAGSAALMGQTLMTEVLEKRIAEKLKLNDCTVFPTGWGAAYGTIRALVSQKDHVVMDIISHASLIEGARAATKNVHFFPNNNTDHLERKLKRIRSDDPSCGILVVTEGLFSMDSTTPDIEKFQELAHFYDATLFLDVAHDFGSMGSSGGGSLEIQDMLGKVDIVMGSFSKSFASNGGFVATNHPSLKLALRYNSGPLTFTNALSPVQAACVIASLDIIQSSEGAIRREKLMSNSISLRDRLSSRGFKVLGKPSAIVPVVLGPVDEARIITREILNSGFLVNLVEYPAVSRNSARWRLQVMADHDSSQINDLVDATSKIKDSISVFSSDTFSLVDVTSLGR